MTPHEMKSARLAKNWTQSQAAVRLGMTQAYLNFLENGKRRLSPKLVRRAASAYGLSPVTLPPTDNFAPANADDSRLADLLAKLGYPGFAYLHFANLGFASPRANARNKNPSEVFLTALAQKSLDGRVAEALPWVAMKYAQPDTWLVENARKFNLQNRLGFVVGLARQLAGAKKEASETSRVDALRELENQLEDSRLAKEDVFYRPPRTESERQWLRENRTNDAAHWNLLTDMRLEHLPYAS